MQKDNYKIQESINILNSSNDYRLLNRVPEELKKKEPRGTIFKIAFIDLETTGLDPKSDEIIEIGLLIVSFTNEDGFINIEYKDNQLKQPNKPISEEITKITGITNEDVRGKKIDWYLLKNKLSDINLVICHNAYFDRNFMELQTPQYFSSLIESKPFACSSLGVNWKLLGYESSKLEYLNLKLGYFYEGHRALIDCFATLNLFTSNPQAFEELKQTAKQKEYLICATETDFYKKDLLKQKGYKWSNGEDNNLPKSWWIIIPEKNYEDEMLFLKSKIYEKEDLNIPTKVITAKERYSYRGERLENLTK